MMRRLLTLLPVILILPVATSSGARMRASSPPPLFAFGPAQNILWIGAHPDDEILASPFLGAACKEFGARCTFLVMTRGEAGDCALPEGCLPDLGTLRVAEMRAAAEVLGGEVIQWTLPNTNALTPGAAEDAWAEASGGHQILLGRLEAVIDAVKPTTIVTFDPAHGSTCHPEHRAVGNLIVEAGSGGAELLFVETLAQFIPDGFIFSSAVGDKATLRFDGARFASPGGKFPWDYLLLDVQQHRSQFTPEQVQSLRETPRQQRYVDFAKPSAALMASPCP
jgi:hypothetical protein